MCAKRNIAINLGSILICTVLQSWLLLIEFEFVDSPEKDRSGKKIEFIEKLINIAVTFMCRSEEVPFATSNELWINPELLFLPKVVVSPKNLWNNLITDYNIRNGWLEFNSSEYSSMTTDSKPNSRWQLSTSTSSYSRFFFDKAASQHFVDCFIHICSSIIQDETSLIVV